jgi:hypothetical protein
MLRLGVESYLFKAGFSSKTLIITLILVATFYKDE